MISAPGHFFYLLLLIAAIFSTSLGVVIGRERRNLPGSRWLIAQLWGVAIWSLGYALELIEPNLPSKILWAKVEYIGIATIPVVWFLFILDYSGGEFSGKRLLRYAIWSVPAITLILAWTNESHGLIWQRLWLDNGGDPVIMMVEHGSWFWVHLAFSYGLLLASTLLTIRMIASGSSKNSLDGPFMLASVVIP